MPLTSADIQFRYSNIHADAADDDAGDPPTSDPTSYSLGKWISTVAWQGTSINDLFDNIAGYQNSANRVDYRCVFVANTHSTLTLYNAVVYFPSQVAGGANCQLSVEVNIDTPEVARVSLIDSTEPQAIALPNAVTVPTDSVNGWTTVFSSAAGSGNAVTIGDIPPGQCAPIWIKRQAQNSAALDSDGFTLRVDGDTPS